VTTTILTYQEKFHQQWQHLQDPHVRSLVWMLTSPGLLEAHSPLWKNQVARLALPDDMVLHTWLAELDRQPEQLHAALDLARQRRLGHYAENLLAFYLRHQGLLFAHGLQVHDTGGTVGEFDFLLEQAGGLLHWELATKFFLLEDSQGIDNDGCSDGFTKTMPAIDLFDYLGPNLADTLGAKMAKIFDQQLALSQHPQARQLLSKVVVARAALVKGWLLYRQGKDEFATVEGLAQDHCRGYWWTRDDIAAQAFADTVILPRLQWLAPAQMPLDAVMGPEALQAALTEHFLRDKTPVMLAVMQRNGNVMQESCRGMVVPDDWLRRAVEKRRRHTDGLSRRQP
jgi:hypothetical protein